MIVEETNLGRRITLTHQEWMSLKHLVESQLKFLSDCVVDFECFPWELFGEELKEEVLTIDKNFISQLNNIGIKTFGLEE